ncbi:hypothetical protein M5K25_004718 [Dendrobium thyrsiflorum]|uniref:Uncharacterized protein n=1 Tax=Dendrobium thyrsiflorum TaxID=117978 RepID=A0ABD0VFK6_DENTH
MACRFYYFVVFLVLLFATYCLAGASHGGDADGNGPGPVGNLTGTHTCLKCEDIPKAIQCNC